MKKDLTNIQTLVSDVKTLIDNAKQKVIRTVDNQRVNLYWHIGQRIFKEEQERKERAEYGKQLIKNLSNEIEPLYGSRYSYRQLYLFLQFYKTFPKVNTLYSELNWSQYKDNETILASQYQLYLPSEKELLDKLDLL